MTNVKESNEKPVRKKREAASLATGETARSGLRAQGVRTRNAIVEVAKKVLLEGGGLEFSLREVAARAGISISNLQYYFPTRLAVLRAVVEPVIETYLREMRSTLNSNLPPLERIVALAEQSLREVKNPEASALWWHFVSFAMIDEECSRLLDDWYETLTREAAELIRSAYPDYSLADCLHRATLLIAITDGLNYQLGAGRRKRNYTRGLDAKFMATVEALLKAPLTTNG
ncbi:TetR/AcrR family transcriptional regulator [Janthinobacterium lividum]|uniref:TetR/AcrR family transcriptional regulator n=1 Tax=Janthinobacterium lividum TaxID=29581 RepID=UPI0014098AF9|nr:TetR/AcrR family transcriptional regulator [Janthinobacterium lividum]NHQ91924.1 TetR/AcrR family transcriptional regulator [Janthinobacterium lividum]